MIAHIESVEHALVIFAQTRVPSDTSVSSVTTTALPSSSNRCFAAVWVIGIGFAGEGGCVVVVDLLEDGTAPFKFLGVCDSNGSDDSSTASWRTAFRITDPIGDGPPSSSSKAASAAARRRVRGGTVYWDEDERGAALPLRASPALVGLSIFREATGGEMISTERASERSLESDAVSMAIEVEALGWFEARILNPGLRAAGPAALLA